MTDVTKAEWVHPFERANLGKAPFRCLGYEKKVYIACHGAPVQPGGSCDYCGTGLIHTYSVIGSGPDALPFTVGCDCVSRTGDTELEEATRREQRAYERRLAAADHKAHKEQLARERAARAADTAARFPETLARLGAAARSDRSPQHERGQLARAFRDLTDGVYGAGRDGSILGEDEQRWLATCERYMALPEPRHLSAAPGQRVKALSCTYEGGPVFDTMYGIKRIARFIVQEGPERGALLVWPTMTPISVDKGAMCTLTATIKRHGDYKGEPQTEVSRAKVEQSA